MNTIESKNDGGGGGGGGLATGAIVGITLAGVVVTAVIAVVIYKTSKRMGADGIDRQITKHSNLQQSNHV